MSVKIKYREPPNGSSISSHIETYASYFFPEANSIRFFPEGRFELLFQMDAQFLQRSHIDSHWLKRPSAFVGGLHDRAYHVRPLSKETFCIGVKFKPDGAKYFIPQKLNSLKNKVVSVIDIWGNAGRDLLVKLKAAKSHHVCFRHIDRFLSRQFSEVDARSLARSCFTHHDKSTNPSVQEMAKEAKLSTGHFRKVFHENIGISPSEYRKIIRVAMAREKLQQHQFHSLTDLALQLGYFDQAHFIREFKSITTMTPSKYFAEMS